MWIATEYCALFPDAEIQTRSLVKLTEEEVEEIRSALGVGLNDVYSMDGYVYYLGDGGWHGFYGNANNGSDSPYITCPVHSQQAWTDYEGNLPAEEDPSGGIIDDDWSEDGGIAW